MADMLRSDVRKGHVWFLNYAALDPNAVTAASLDLHGSGMLAEDVETFAHRWLAYSRSVDIQHDGIGRPIHVIESFFNSPDIASPAWPVNSHALRLDMSSCKEAMEGFAAGRLNSVSLDAFTFDVVRRLPVAAATTKSAGPPPDAATIAVQVAELGYTGVTGAFDLGGGLFLVSRGESPAVAVEVSSEEYEVTAGGGAWATLAARLISNGTLGHVGAMPSMEGAVPTHVTMMCADHRADASLLTTRESHAYIGPDGRGVIPHHTPFGVSMKAVYEGLVNIDKLVPEPHRQAVRAHLVSHMSAR